MSKPKFTPMPWTYAPPWSGFTQITGPDGKLIFAIAAGLPEEKRSDEECDANLRLSTAAPEMYALLERIFDHGRSAREWADWAAIRAKINKEAE